MSCFVVSSAAAQEPQEVASTTCGDTGFVQKEIKDMSKQGSRRNPSKSVGNPISLNRDHLD